MDKLKILRVFFALCLINSVIVLFLLLRTPSQAKNVAILGYSWTRLSVATVPGLASLAFLWLTITAWQRSTSQKAQQVEIWLGHHWSTPALFISALSVAIVSATFLFFLPRTNWGSFHGYFVRLVPLAWWLIILSFLTLVTLIFLRDETQIFDLLKSVTIKVSSKEFIKYISYCCFFVTIILGIFLRAASFKWNDQLNGDVNLFALTAREFVLNNRLYYPMKYEYSDNVHYLVLASPASQHPPLWPFLAGLFGKFFSTDDTFTILKLMSEVSGIVLIVIIPYGGFKKGWLTEGLLAVVLIALSPMLVDFSANGSSYILTASLITLAVVLLQSFNHHKLAHYIFAGVLCGISLLTHTLLFFLVVIFLAFWFWDRTRIHWKGILAFFLSMFLILSPWMLWNIVHFGKPFYSYSSFHLLKKLELAKMGMFRNVFTTRLVKPFDLTAAKNYLTLIQETIVDFPNSLFSELGPYCLTLSIIGMVALVKRDIRKALALVLPFVVYSIVIILWPKYKPRFLVPLLPLIYIAAAFGFKALFKNRLTWKIIAVILLAGTIAWKFPDFFKEEPTKYYKDSISHVKKYEQMEALARDLQSFESGTVLGYADTLDGGIDTVYYHRFPYVHGRDFTPNDLIKLVHDFDIRYIWTDTIRADTVRTELPEADLILQNDLFFVYELDMRD